MSCIEILARRCKASVVLDITPAKNALSLDITPAKSALSISASKVCSISQGVELYAFDEIRLYANDMALYGDVN